MSLHEIYFILYVCRVMLVAKDLESKANLTEKYYGAKYNVEKIDPKLIEVRHIKYVVNTKNYFLG